MMKRRGESETLGREWRSRILRYQTSKGLDPAQFFWCIVFVNALVLYVHDFCCFVWSNFRQRSRSDDRLQIGKNESHQNLTYSGEAGQVCQIQDLHMIQKKSRPYSLGNDLHCSAGQEWSCSSVKDRGAGLVLRGNLNTECFILSNWSAFLLELTCKFLKILFLKYKYIFYFFLLKLCFLLNKLKNEIVVPFSRSFLFILIAFLSL